MSEPVVEHKAAFTVSEPERVPGPEAVPKPAVQTRTIRLVGSVPSDVWNRLGMTVLLKLRSAVVDPKSGVNISVAVNRGEAGSLTADVRQILDDLNLTDAARLDEE